MQINQTLAILVQAGTLIAAFAGIAASVVMFSLTRKFGQGILASSFKTVSWGVIFVTAALVVDAFGFYLAIQENALLTLVKAALLILGTYIIVIGAKNTADKLENIS